MINFNVAKCQSESQAERFGLHDPQDGGAAYIDESGQVVWNCVVLNPAAFPCVFTAIDHCIEIVDQDGNLKRSCDGMLTYKGHVILVELKHRGSDWISLGVDQLRQTTVLLMEGRNAADFRKKLAVLANSKHPQFKFGHQSTMEQFRQETGFRLLIVGEIKLK
ncbi:hypothetical protein QWY85_01405 [Neolewinella lacunae]|uniref:Uncharacterized protein n=1 Tax=Neolewinella lacunae TaxID=1517758 RepID=A0A923TD23_9BACT|nr:hypothetical protein [Neolewinella lacunae]MBC6994362.1 hypothetical protein [Neolewinella lacunae]MDN3633293.1 hypothetical protein [Neolewinella lacunae]